MDYLGHLLIGFLLCLTSIYFLYPEIVSTESEVILFLFIGMLSAIIPDLDHPKSKGTKIMNGTVFILLILFSYKLFFITFSSDSFIIFLFFSAVFCLAWLGLSNLIRPKHRGITHTLLAVCVYSIILYFVFGILFLLAGAIGYFSHLIADKCFKII